LEILSPGKKSLIKWGLMLGLPLASIFLGLLALFILKKRREAMLASLKI